MEDSDHTLMYAGTANLQPGDRVRHRKHPDLVGEVKCYEWTRPGVLSAIPYNVAWDDEQRASVVIGWFWIYASDDSIEALPQ